MAPFEGTLDFRSRSRRAAPSAIQWGAWRGPVVGWGSFELRVNHSELTQSFAYLRWFPEVITVARNRRSEKLPNKVWYAMETAPEL